MSSGSFAHDIMLEFAALTGLTANGEAPRRYLWTDAFAVCNFLELFRRTHDAAHLALALRLVDQVHHTLGRHRADDPRSGWISGLSQEEGELHPTAGGLRIGKSLNERRHDEVPDARLEWEQDGQYYHYLTKWMHALNRVGRVTGDPVYVRWAMELARAVHARFVYLPAGASRKRMYWKMSIDLGRPLVPSMGQHDPLDGLVTYCELQAAASGDLEGSALPGLDAEIADMAAICREEGWTTDDPLGIGGLLADAWRIAQLKERGECGAARLLETVLDAARLGLESFAGEGSLGLPAAYRLPFRELGLAIGLKGVECLREWLEGEGTLAGTAFLRRRVEALAGYVPLAAQIERFWLDDRNRATASWREHREINMVMLATSLAPEGFLAI